MASEGNGIAADGFGDAEVTGLALGTRSPGHELEGVIDDPGYGDHDAPGMEPREHGVDVDLTADGPVPGDDRRVPEHRDIGQQPSHRTRSGGLLGRTQRGPALAKTGAQLTPS